MQTKYVGCMLITPQDQVLLIRYNANGNVLIKNITNIYLNLK